MQPCQGDWQFAGQRCTPGVFHHYDGLCHFASHSSGHRVYFVTPYCLCGFLPVSHSVYPGFCRNHDHSRPTHDRCALQCAAVWCVPGDQLSAAGGICACYQLLSFFGYCYWSGSADGTGRDCFGLQKVDYMGIGSYHDAVCGAVVSAIRHSGWRWQCGGQDYKVYDQQSDPWSGRQSFGAFYGDTGVCSAC